jgi:hypothetical protein
MKTAMAKIWQRLIFQLLQIIRVFLSLLLRLLVLEFFNPFRMQPPVPANIDDSHSIRKLSVLKRIAVQMLAFIQPGGACTQIQQQALGLTHFSLL